MKSEKKVVVVVVEGSSDEIALGSVLKNYFSSKEVQFAVVHGDITSDYATTTNNVVSKIGNLVETIRIKYGYRKSDFVQVIHITDTDGAFTKGCIKECSVKKVMYYEDYMETPNIKETESRNIHKAGILSKLYSTGKVSGIDYRIYFNSCNLEHVLYNQLKDFSDSEKEKLSDDFAEKYEENLQGFIEFISDSALSVSGTYRDTWKFIEKDNNSLKRHSNMHLIFESQS